MSNQNENEVVITNINEGEPSREETAHNKAIDFNEKLQEILNTKFNIVYKAEVKTKIDYSYSSEKKYFEDLLKFFNNHVEARGEDVFHLDQVYDTLTEVAEEFKKDKGYVVGIVPNQIEKLYQCALGLSAVRGKAQIEEKLRMLFPLNLTLGHITKSIEKMKQEVEEYNNQYADIINPTENVEEGVDSGPQDSQEL